MAAGVRETMVEMTLVTVEEDHLHPRKKDFESCRGVDAGRFKSIADSVIIGLGDQTPVEKPESRLPPSR
ncbi:hypothetical protein PDE_08967 [Penicillium oxalicum 114-2]|uniref:Uncharacterized protein n=1 Tax=Penicillium oxalicum (strain 114-2 / CGMCC 5302) TaxID=933388 RepID=S7ZTG8_PENO1|nr:hypothetical protein PDE_08967 [Penicillium oxalicum 114-2]